MVTFIITLVVTALITYIITSTYYKHLIDHIRKPVISQEGDSHALIDDQGHDPVYATIAETNIAMNTDPAHGTGTAIKMNVDPAYATITSTT